MVAIGYALVLLLSWRVLNEDIGALRIAGTLVICAGVALVARS
jgi:multidrug transporter EmrE-like cation transporter